MPENVSPPSPNGQNQEDKKPRFNLYTWLFDNPERFFWVIVSLGILGGLAALVVPNCIDWQISSNNSAEPKADEIRQKSISDLRLHILYITGGIIAILTLLQNSWKNQIDRRKIEDDIQKNKNDYNRQVRAERRSRYTKAVEQLASDKAAVRLGGVYTLVGLVDEWLADNNFKQEESQKESPQEEAQVIINNLCAYIRSIPSGITNIALESDFSSSDEAKIRQTIFSEMSSRLNPEKYQKSSWVNFEFDFSDSPIFYPLDDKIFMNANFQKSHFYETASFSRSKFYGTTMFNKSDFYIRSKFNKSEFHGPVHFTSVRLSIPPTTNAEWQNMKKNLKDAFNYASVPRNTKSIHRTSDFSGTIFKEEVNFDKVYFYERASFEESNFIHKPNFDSSFFTCKEQSKFSTLSKNIQLGAVEMVDKSGVNCTLEIPIGSYLFDPQSWNSKEEKYTHTSKSDNVIKSSIKSPEESTE